MSTTVTLTRPLYGPHVTVERVTRYSDEYVNRLEQFDDSWRGNASYADTWLWRSRAPDSRIGDAHYRGEFDPALFLVGWADPITGAAGSPMSGQDEIDGERVLVRIARRFDAWQGKPPLAASLGQPLPIHDSMASLLEGIASSMEFGYAVPWGKGTITVVPRSLADDILRCDVTATVDHEHLKRPAHHELKGTLDLWTPRGWPKRFVADGKWRTHLFVLAGRTVLDGTFHVEFDWSYGTDPPLTAPPATPGSPSP